MPPKQAQDTRRDNFTAQVVKILAERSGGKCAICRATTWGPNDSQFKATNIGQAAHITAAAPNGPRFDPKMSPERRSSALNGMWLCGNCHQKIDKDVNEYPVQKLLKLKQDAEENARKELGVAPAQAPQSRDDSPITIATSASAIMEIRKAKSALQDLTQGYDKYSEATDILEQLKYINVEDDNYLPEVGTELLQFYRLLVIYDTTQSTWLQVIRLLKEVSNTYHTTMSQDDVDTACRIVSHMINNNVQCSKMQSQSATAFLTTLARQLKDREDISNTAQDELLTVKANTRPQRRNPKRGGNDSTDGGNDSADGGKDSTDSESSGDEAYKYQAVEESDEWQYILTMCELVGLSDDERHLKEASLEEKGNITYVV